MTPEQVSNITYALAALAGGVTIVNVTVMFLTAWFTIRTVRSMLNAMEHHADGWKRAADAEASKSVMAAEYVRGMEQIVQSVVDMCGRLAPRVGALVAEVDELSKGVAVMGLKVEGVIEKAGARSDRKQGVGTNA